MSGRSDPHAEPEESAPRGARHGHRLLKVAALGGAAAVLLNEEMRGHLLDLLFGAEEEFNYSSVTEPPPPQPGGAPSPTEPWVRTPIAPDEPPTSDVPQDGEVALGAADVQARGSSSIAPSPAAWRASAGHDEVGVDATPPSVTGAPPQPPRDWWAPTGESAAPDG